MCVFVQAVELSEADHMVLMRLKPRNYLLDSRDAVLCGLLDILFGEMAFLSLSWRGCCVVYSTFCLVRWPFFSLSWRGWSPLARQRVSLSLSVLCPLSSLSSFSLISHLSLALLSILFLLSLLSLFSLFLLSSLSLSSLFSLSLLSLKSI